MFKNEKNSNETPNTKTEFEAILDGFAKLGKILLGLFVFAFFIGNTQFASDDWKEMAHTINVELFSMGTTFLANLKTIQSWVEKPVVSFFLFMMVVYPLSGYVLFKIFYDIAEKNKKLVEEFKKRKEELKNRRRENHIKKDLKSCKNKLN